MKRLNLKFLFISLALAVALGGAAIVAYKVQKKRSVAALLAQARIAEQAGNNDKADELYAHYLAFRPEDSATLSDYGNLLARRADSRDSRLKALSVLDQVLRRNSGRTDIRREMIRLAMDRTVQQYSLARGQIEALLAESPGDGDLETQAGLCLEAERKYQEAAEVYARATEHAPTMIEGYIRYAELLRGRMAKPAEADKVLDRMVERNPGSYRAYLERGEQRRKAGADGAERDIARAQELAPDEVDVMAAAAEFAIGKGEVEVARRQIARCLDLRPKEARLYDLSSRIELAAGHVEEAESFLRQGVENVLEPEGRMRLVIELANLQLARGDLPGVERAIESMKREEIRPGIVKFFEAHVLVRKGQWREAAQVLDEAHPDMVESPDLAYQADLILARCCERLGEDDRRYAAYNRAVALKPMGLPARLGLAETLESAGRIEEAIALYQKIEGDDPKARTGLCRLLIRRNLQQPPTERDLAEVDKALTAAKEASKDSLEVQLLHVEALTRRGRLDAARTQLEATAARFPDRAEPRAALATLALMEGRPELADSGLTRAFSELGDGVVLRLARASVLVARGAGAVGEMDLLEEGLDKLPVTDRARLLRGLVEAHNLIGDLPGARRVLDRLAIQDPEDLGVRLIGFDLAIRSGDAAGMKAMIEAIGDRNEVTARLARARYSAWLASRNSRQDPAAHASLNEARRLLTQVTIQRQGWLPAVIAGAYVEDLGGNREGAVRGYLQAIDLGDRGPETIRRAIQLLGSLGRFDRADEVVHKVLNDGGSLKDPQFYRLAAETALRVKDFPRALEYGDKAVSPNSTDTRDRLWRGRLFWAAGKTTQAEADLRAATTAAGEVEAPDAWATLVSYLVATGRRVQAEEAVEQARKKLAEQVRPLALARCFAVLSRPEQAREQYRIAVAASPEESTTLLTATNVALRIGEVEDAKAYLRKIVDRQIDAPEEATHARRILSLLLAASGDHRQVLESLSMMGLVDDGLPDRPASDQSIDDLRSKAAILTLRGGRQNRRAALEMLTNIVGREKPSPDDRFLLAQVLLRDGQWPKAREQMQLLLADFGNSPEFLAFHVQGLLQHGDVAGGRIWLKKFEAVEPSSFRLAELKARAANAEGRHDDAANLLNDYARTTPESTIQAALLLESLGRIPEAEDLFRRYASQEKKPEAALPLAAFLGRRKRVTEALDLCDSVWKTDHPELVSQACVAVLYASMANQEACGRVAARLEEAIRREPENITIQFGLANVRILQGQIQGAEAIFRRIYEMDKDNMASANNLAWLLSMQDGKASESLVLIDRTISLAGPLPALLDTRGTARMALGQVEAAIEDLEEATNSGPSAVGYFHLAQAYLRMNRFREAQESLQEAKMLGLEEGSLHPVERNGYRHLLDELARR